MMVSNLRWSAAREVVNNKVSNLTSEELASLPSLVYSLIFGKSPKNPTYNLFSDLGDEIIVTNQINVGTFPMLYGAILTLHIEAFSTLRLGDKFIIEEDRGLRLFQLLRYELVSLGKKYNDLFVIVADLGEAHCG